MPQASFRLFHAAHDARIAGKIEGDHGNLWMYCLRPQQNGFRLLNTLAPPNRIREANPPALIFWLNLYEVASKRRGHIPFLSRHVEVHTRTEDFIAMRVLRCDLLESKGRIF